MTKVEMLMELVDDYVSKSVYAEQFRSYGVNNEERAIAEAEAVRQKLIKTLEESLPKEPSRQPTPDVLAKIESNTWDNLGDVLPVMVEMSKGYWYWGANTRCKYFELRIDTRTGSCIIRDSDRVRISPEQLAHQSRSSQGMPGWHEFNSPLIK